MKKKQIIILASAGVAVILLLVGLFVVLPAMQVNAYKQTVTTKQSELKDTVNKLTAVLERDSFTKSDVEASVTRSDVKVGNEAIQNVEAKLDIAKKDLANFNSLPFLGFNQNYKTATDLKADEQEYITKTEAFVAEMKTTLTYMDKSSDLFAKFASFSAASAKIESAESFTEYADVLDATIKDVQPALDDMAKLVPSSSLKEGHDYTIKAMGEFIALYKEFTAAVRASDVTKIESTYVQVGAKIDEIAKKSDDYNAKFIRESPLRKLNDALNQLDREISRKLASL